MDDASDPDIWITWVMLAGFSLAQAAGGSGFGVDPVTAMSLSSCLGSPGFIPMLSAISACKLSSILLSTGSPERSASKTH